MRLERDVVADGGRCSLAHRDPHALRFFIDARRLEFMDTHDDAVALLALLAHFDKARDLRGPCRNLQHRMRDACGVQSNDAKAGRQRSEPKCQRKANRPPPRSENHDECRKREAASGPPGGLAVGAKIQRDACAKRDWQPG